MRKTWIVAAGIGGFVGVAGGALGDHAYLDDAHAAALVATACRYLMFHALALLGLDGIARPAEAMASGGRLLATAGWLFLAGMVLFSGSLLVLAASGIGAVAMLTPFGGASLLLGWIALAVYGIRRAGPG